MDAKVQQHCQCWKPVSSLLLCLPPNPCSQTPAELGPMQGRVSGQQGRQQDQEAGQQQQELGLSLIPADGHMSRKVFRMGLVKMWTSQNF